LDFKIIIIIEHLKFKKGECYIMGLMDLVKKAFLGATDEENQKNKARMREIFNESVPNGDDYKLIYCHMENFTNAVVVKVTKHANYIVGYKEGEVVVIPVNPDLLDYDKPYVFNKKNESETKTSLGYCIVANPEIKFQFIPITYEPALAGKKDYSVAITQSSAEVAESKYFFKKGL
jgi:hypothetical protein